MIRKKGLGFLLAIFAVFFVLSILLTDLWLENILEDQASDAVGALVEIDDLDFSFFGPSLSWQRLQVTNPRNTMSNMIETGFCEFRMEFWPLLRAKAIISNVELSEVRSGTARETDGALPRKAEKEDASKSDNVVAKTGKRLEKEVKSTPQMRLAAAVKDVNVDSIVSVMQLQTPGKIDSLNKKLQSDYAGWQQKLQEMDVEKDVAGIKEQIATIDPDKLKEPQQFVAALKTADEIQKTIKNKKQNITASYDSINAQYGTWRQNLKQVDDWLAADYKRALETARLPDYSFKDLARILFGEAFYGRMGQYLGYLGYAREMVNTFSSSNEKEESPPRLEGQDIYFGGATLPKFWMKQLSLSGTLGADMQLAGSVSNVTSNPPLVGEPAVITASADNGNNKTFKLNAVLDYLEKEPRETVEMNYSGFAVDRIKLGGSSSPYLPRALASSSGTLDASLESAGDKLEAKVRFSASRAQFEFAQESKDEIARLVQRSFREVSEVTLSARIRGKGDDLDIALNTNLDNRLAQAFKENAGARVREARQKLERKVKDAADKKRAELQQQYQGYKEEIEQKIAGYRAQLDGQLEKLEAEKKKLEEKKNDLADKAKNKLKDLFKK